MTRFARAGFLLYGLALTLASLTPGDELPNVQYNDKLAHFGAYLLFTLLAAASVTARRYFLRLAVALVIYGLALEGLQSLPGSREPSLLDAIANTAGVALGVMLASRYWPYWR